MQLVILFGISIALVTSFFALQNNAIVSIQLFSWNFQGSLSSVLLATFAMGFLTSSILSLPTIIKYQWRLSAEKRKTRQFETSETKPKPDSESTQ